MSYYDDWVEPNAFFRGGWRLTARPRKPKLPRDQVCPFCGRKFACVADHIKAKHPAETPHD